MARQPPGTPPGSTAEADTAPRAVHYLNQFFAGLGGEEAAHLPPQRLPGAVGPGRGLGLPVVATLVCGDDYFGEHEEEALATLLGLLREERPDILVLGPAFGSGRYGYACGRLAATAGTLAGITAVTGMHPENPGVMAAGGHAYIVPTGISVSGMRDVLPVMSRLITTLAGGLEGPPEEKGYLPRGLRRNLRADRPGAARAVDLLLAKLSGDVHTEVAGRLAAVPPPPPIRDLAGTAVALVTEGGLVPSGNPDRVPTIRAQRWHAYPLPDTLSAETHESVHGGFPVHDVNDDPNRLLPLDAVRTLQAEGVLGPVHGRFYTTTGNGTPVAMSEQMGREIAASLREADVGAAILTAT